MINFLKKHYHLFLYSVRCSFTFHLNGKHKVDLTEIKNNPHLSTTLTCSCGKKFYYCPESDFGEFNVGMIVDENGCIYRYYKWGFTKNYTQLGANDVSCAHSQPIRGDNDVNSNN